MLWAGDSWQSVLQASSFKRMSGAAERLVSNLKALVAQVAARSDAASECSELQLLFCGNALTARGLAALLPEMQDALGLLSQPGGAQATSQAAHHLRQNSRPRLTTWK